MHTRREPRSWDAGQLGARLCHLLGAMYCKGWAW